MLKQLKEYLQTKRITSLFELVNAFGCEPDVIRDMLQRWINKGKVQRCQRTPACGKRCIKCDPLMTELYQWITPQGQPIVTECAVFQLDKQAVRSKT